ncbi:MAG: hypothetical protein J7J89_06345, partial [Thermoplasmata archaeon]|nr:hypothetical protein [Thermoplasmata archaeon]
TSYTWNVPNESYTGCKIRVGSYNPSNGHWIVYDDSDNTFNITSGEPKSIHTWLDGPNDSDIYNYDIDFKIDTWLSDPDPDWLYYWALCVWFSDEQGNSCGAAHGGLQWASGGKKANWGGYELVDGTQSIVINYDWEPGKWYRYRVWGLGQNSDGSYNWGFWILDYETNVETFVGSVTSWGKYINDICVFTETGYGVLCDTPSVQVRWRNPAYRSFTIGGDILTPISGFATYNGTCSDPHNTDQRLVNTNPIEFLHLTNTIRTTDNNTYLFQLSSSLTIDPQNTNIIYAGADGAGVFKSIDGGTPWIEINNGLTNHYILSLAIDPENTSTLYAATRGSGVFKYIYSAPSQYFKTNFPDGDNVFSTNDTIHITWDVEGFTGDEGRIRIFFYPGGGGPYSGWYPIVGDLPIQDGSHDLDLSDLRDINGNPIPLYDPLRCRIRVGIYVPSSPGSFGGPWLKWNTPYGTKGQYYDETGHFWIID